MTTKDHILQFLITNGPEWGGVVCRAVHDITGTKESVVERRCRELVNESKIQVCYKQVNDKGPFVSRYRIPVK